VEICVRQDPDFPFGSSQFSHALLKGGFTVGKMYGVGAIAEGNI
jgi:hypothetical protein